MYFYGIFLIWEIFSFQICEQLIANLMKHKSCWPFLNPVNKKEVRPIKTL
jgi:hypothetical protein